MPTADLERGLKICSRCNVEKELAEFYRNKRNSDGLDYYCKSCRSGVSAEYHESASAVMQVTGTRDWIRDHREELYDLAVVRGLTLDEFVVDILERALLEERANRMPDELDKLS